MSPALCRFLYVFVDKDRGGYMTSEQYSEFLEQLHPYEKLRYYCTYSYTAFALCLYVVHYMYVYFVFKNSHKG